MKNNKWMWSIAGFGAIVAVLGVAQFARGGADRATPATPRAIAASSTGDVRSIVLAVPFVLDEPWTHVWRAEQPSFRAGWLVVIDVDPDLAQPTQRAEPVLCAGGETLERFNHGFDGGRIVALLPSELGLDGRPALDLARQTFYFAAPELPERVGARWIETEERAAKARGAGPFDAAAIAAARVRGGDPIAVRDRVELDQLAAELILREVPSERERADALLVPVQGR